MIELNDLINGNLEEDEFGIVTWGFYQCPIGSIKLNSITWPIALGNINFEIQKFYADGLLYDNKYKGIVPVSVELKSCEERIKGKYNTTYFPVHEYYEIPSIHYEGLLSPCDKLNEKLYQFEKLINNFYATKKEIEAVKEYIIKFFMNRKELLNDLF